MPPCERPGARHFRATFISPRDRFVDATARTPVLGPALRNPFPLPDSPRPSSRLANGNLATDQRFRSAVCREPTRIPMVSSQPGVGACHTTVTSLSDTSALGAGA